MVGRRRGRRQRLAASHQRAWLWGRHAVEELLAAGRWRPLELRLAERLDPGLRARLEALSAAERIDCATAPFEQLTRWCGTAEHQGAIALMPPFPYLTVDEVLIARPATTLWLVLDRLQDPFNFGAVLRSAEALGVGAVLVGAEGQCDVTPHVVRSSAGAVHHLRLCRAEDLPSALTALQEAGGCLLVATAGDAPRTIAEQDFRGPTAIVIGNEGVGVSPELRARCGASVRIPQTGRIGSLNAAVAAGIVLYEAQRQRAQIDVSAPRAT